MSKEKNENKPSDMSKKAKKSTSEEGGVAEDGVSSESAFEALQEPTYKWFVVITREDGGGRILREFDHEEDMKLFVGQQVFEDSTGKYVDVFFGSHFPLSNMEKKVKVGNMEIKVTEERAFFDGFVEPH